MSVVIVNWNGLSDTLECLGSLSRATYPGLSVVVVDNGSRSGEAAAIRAAYPPGGPVPVEVVETGRNLGFAGGNNVGIGRALVSGADYVLCLNNDTVVAPGFLEPLVAALEREPRIGAAGAAIYYAGQPAELWYAGGRFAPFPYTAHVTGAPPDVPWQETEFVCGCALLARAGLLSELGGFDERFFAYAEDADLSLRIRARGLRCVVVPSSHVWHKVGRATGGERSPESSFYGIRNARLLLLKHGTPADRVTGSARYLALYLPQLLSPDCAQVEATLQALWCAHTGRWGSREAHGALRPACARAAAALTRVSRGYWRLRGSVQKAVRGRRPEVGSGR